MANRPQRSPTAQFVTTAAQFTGMGWLIAIGVLLGVLAGNWLDSRVASHPLFLVVGLFVGLGLGLFAAGRMLMAFLGDSRSGQ